MDNVKMVKKIKHKNAVGLTADKKEILKKLMGSASSKQIDYNKVRDEWKYATN